MKHQSLFNQVEMPGLQPTRNANFHLPFWGTCLLIVVVCVIMRLRTLGKLVLSRSRNRTIVFAQTCTLRFASNRLLPYKQKLLTLLFALLALSMFGQTGNVGIGTVDPEPSAILDIASDDRGVLIPRHSTESRLAIVNPAQGLIVYDTSKQAIYYYDSTEWVNLNDRLLLVDSDGDTKVSVDKYAIDEDVVRIDLDGTEHLVLRKNLSGTNALIDVPNNNGNILIGQAAGENVDLGTENILIGKNAGHALGNGVGNIFIGDQAGELATNAFTNIYIGKGAGRTSISGDNIYIGLNSGTHSTTASENIFLGSYSGFANTTGNKSWHRSLTSFCRDIWQLRLCGR